MNSGIYFLRYGALLKIGRSRNIAVRLKRLKVKDKLDPERMELLGVVGLSEIRHEETHAKRQLAEFRHVGEWFTLSPACQERITGWIQAQAIPETVVPRMNELYWAAREAKLKYAREYRAKKKRNTPQKIPRKFIEEQGDLSHTLTSLTGMAGA